MQKSTPRIVLVTRRTRMDRLLDWAATKGQARFNFRGAKIASFAQAGMMDAAVEVQKADSDEDFDEMEEEHQNYEQSVSYLRRTLSVGMPVQSVDRELVPTIDFTNCACIVVAGPDGLVANTAKYAAGVPIVGVNPDPERIDGVLLPFEIREASDAVKRVLMQCAVIRSVSLAEARLHDGQRLLAFNDFFIGARTHTSARYEIGLRGGAENVSEFQSSSGVLVATGAGSTGWMSSVYNMACGVAQWLKNDVTAEPPPPLTWESRELLWAVREPFRTQTTGVSMIAGRLAEDIHLRIESQMAYDGVIFSDGVENDFLRFNGGAIVTIRLAPETARLVVARPAAR